MMYGFVFILMMIICRLGYLWAADRFCRKYLEISQSREMVWLALLLGGDILFRILQENFAALPNLLFTAGWHVIMIGLVVVLFGGETERKLLTASILTTVTTLTGIFFISLLSCLVLVWKHAWHHMPAPLIEAGEGELLVCGVQLAEMLVVYLLSGWRISFMEQENVSEGLKKGYAVLAIPLFVITLVIDVANWGASHGVMVRSGGNMGLYYDQIFSNMEFLILTALFLFAVGFYLYGLDKIYLEQKKSSRYQAQIAAYQMLEEQYSQAERLRHDMKNHVIALSGLLEIRDWEKLSEYLDNMRESGGIGKGEEATGNRAVDALLYQKRQTAQSRQIRWECDVQIPKSCPIHDFDLCVLFGNILDNAVEACERMGRGGLSRQTDDTERERFIHMQARTVKRCFLLEVSNSVCPEEGSGGKPARKGRAEGWRTHGTEGPGKKDVKRQGIGLINVRDMVRRYDGVFGMEFQEGVFSISILIPLEEKSEKREEESEGRRSRT